MAHETSIIPYHSFTAATAPAPGSLKAGELAFNGTDKVVYTSTDGADIITLLSASGSTGIADSATGVRLTLTDDNVLFGTTGAEYFVGHLADDQALTLTGGNAANSGANIVAYGGTHATRAGDLEVRSGADVLLSWDESDDAWSALDKTFGRMSLLDWSEVVNDIGSTGGGIQDIDLELGNVVAATVDTSAVTFTFSNPIASGTSTSFTLILTDGGSQTVVWPASVDWPGATAPTLTAAGVDILVFTTVDGGTTWHGVVASTDSQ